MTKRHKELLTNIIIRDSISNNIWLRLIPGSEILNSVALTFSLYVQLHMIIISLILSLAKGFQDGLN